MSEKVISPNENSMNKKVGNRSRGNINLANCLLKLTSPAVYAMVRRELGAFFFSPIAYVVIIAFWIVCGVFFWSTFFLQGQAEMRSFFEMLPWILPFIAPAVAMRMFAEERSTGTYELLATLPVTLVEIVVAKFLAAFIFCGGALLIILLYGVSISFLGDLDWGLLFGGFLGALFLMAFYVSVGLFASALTRNQIVAFLVGLAICLVFFLVDKFLFFLPTGLLSFFTFISSSYHFKNVARGVIDLRDIAFFVVFTFIFLSAVHFTLKRQFEAK